MCLCVCVCVVGLLVDMKGLVVTSVALGKAHGVLLTNRGQVFTFGPNNKGQCGREFTSGGQPSKERTWLYVDLICLSVHTRHADNLETVKFTEVNIDKDHQG